MPLTILLLLLLQSPAPQLHRRTMPPPLAAPASCHDQVKLTLHTMLDAAEVTPDPDDAKIDLDYYKLVNHDSYINSLCADAQALNYYNLLIAMTELQRRNDCVNLGKRAPKSCQVRPEEK
jgi:hypothetical protein